MTDGLGHEINVRDSSGFAEYLRGIVDRFATSRSFKTRGEKGYSEV